MRPIWFLTSAPLALLTLSGVVHAQVAGGPAASTRSPAETTPVAAVAEVVVTANKSVQNVQKVAAAITALSSDQLVRIGGTDLSAISQLVPSLEIAPVRSSANVFLRGVGQGIATPNADPAVAVTLDGIYLPQQLAGTSFYDLSRIEVLPGPQGTLYGRAATGGVINLISRTPGSRYEADGFFEYGNYNRVQVSGGVDLPITDTFGLRVAGQHLQHDGYYSNGLDDQDSISARVTAVWKPLTGTSITAIAAYDHEGGKGLTDQQQPPLNGDYRTLPFDSSPYYQDNGVYQFVLQIDQRINDYLKFTSLTGYNKFGSHLESVVYNNAAPTAPIPYTNFSNTDSVSQEFRLGIDTKRLQANIGAYVFHEADALTQTITLSPVIVSNTGPYRVSGDNQSAFAQGTYSLVGGLRVIGGIRYSHDTKDVDGQSTLLVGGRVRSSATYIGQTSLDRVDYKGGIEYDLGPQNMFYANIATAYTPGGFALSTVLSGATAAQQFQPEYLTAYTAGIKNRFFGQRLTVNVEGFYYDYKNYQVGARDPVTGNTNVYNAAKAEIYGAQIDTRFLISDRDTLALSVSPLSAKAITLSAPGCTPNCNGYQLPFAPDLTVNASYQHEFRFFGGNLTPEVDGEYRSERWGIFSHNFGTHLKSDTRLNSTLTFEPAGQLWSIALWGRNLLNSDVAQGILTSTVPGLANYILEPPRTYGVRLSARF